MADNSPRVRASANLDVISPAPVHPSSPVIVPSLQNQADTYSNASLHRASVSLSPSVSDTFNLNFSGPNNPAYGEPERVRDASLHTSIEEALWTLGSSSNRSYGRGPEPDKLSRSFQSSAMPTAVKEQDGRFASTIGNSSTDAWKQSNPNPISQSGPYQFFPRSGQDGLNRHNTNLAQQRDGNLSTNYPEQYSTGYPVDTQTRVDNIVAHAAAAAAANPSSDNHWPSQSILPPYQASMRQEPPVPYSFPRDSVAFAPATPYLSGGGYGGTALATFPAAPNSATSPPRGASAFTPISTNSAASQPPSISNSRQQNWDSFLREERQYLVEGKWSRFPDGSRIFIGNLLCEAVSKRAVFDAFSRYGRLAQISLKQSYGFVQFHTAEDGQAAMNALQGIELCGRKLNLEFSRVQKKDGEGNRSKRTRRGSDPSNTNRGRPDGGHSSRQPSPRRGYHRQQESYDNNDRGRSYRQSSYYKTESGPYEERRRSQSPVHRSHDRYRQRSPSPRRRDSVESILRLPRDPGEVVPDVRIVLLEEVDRAFVSYVKEAFRRHGLTIAVMSGVPYSHLDAMIQREVLWGVDAIAELDGRAQQSHRIGLQIFDRSAGHGKVRFDQYKDLDPETAAQLVIRAKSTSNPTSYPYSSARYTSASHRLATPTIQYGFPSAAPPIEGNSLQTTDLRRVIDSLNGQQDRTQLDVHTVLATLQASPHGATNGHSSSATPSGGHYRDPVHDVQSIMNQLQRFRQ
ncbi:hypothetical protein GGS20DRAFT_41863 [Poronia punctata]|nr:hypothetical protein GGS20DRAFT_41863 [Poronia punctata]